MSLTIIERIKLYFRAMKYKYKNDKGGIAYVNDAIREGQTALDIGAHKGGYAYFMANKVGKMGKVYAFEPQHRLFQYLSKLKQILPWDNIFIEHLAVSDIKGETELAIPDNKIHSGSSPGASIATPVSDSQGYSYEMVQTQKLDDYCLEHNIIPHFIKIDVEGNELKVLVGARQILLQHKPKLLVEIEARHVGEAKVMETFQYLEDLGYHGYILHGLNKIPLKQFSFSVHQNLNDKSHYCNNFIFEAKV